MSSNTIFTPVQTTEEVIKQQDIHNGWLYFATDTGRMYLDTVSERIPVGGVTSGVSIYYGNADEPIKDETADLYTILKTEVADGPLEEEDLILNSDGGFYKVKSITQDSYICTLLSISGTGGGGSPITEKKPTIKFTISNTNLINGQQAYFTIEGKSALEDDGITPIDTDLYVTYSLGTRINQSVVNNYYQTTIKYPTDNGHFVADIEFGAYLKPSASSVLTVYIWGGNHDAPSSTRSADISSSALKLSQLSSYSPANRYPISGFSLNCNVIGAVDKILKCYFDGKLFDTKTIPYSTSNSNPSFTIPAGAYDNNGNPVWGTATHGHHTVRMELYQKLADGTEGLSVEPLNYEIAVIENNPDAKPVIWLGDYRSVYYTYDTIQIPFLVWDPANTSAVKVHLYKNKIEQEGSPRDINNFTSYNYWEIADADFDQLNSYQISCGETEDRYVEREIQFNIEIDPNRTDFEIIQSDLNLNFTATGRSNSEPLGKRQNWSYILDGVRKQAEFTDFNWYNNGWYMDNDINTSCVRISNGAQLSIPYKPMVFASSESDKQSHTVELQFKVSNIQKYGNLITNITRYKGDETYYENFKKQEKDGYDNYDIYLQKTLDADVYEALTDTENFDRVQKIISTNNIVAGLYDINGDSVTGFCIGPQDAFFSNGTDTVNVNFVENELINLSFVYQQTETIKQLYIYINGCITGVIKSSIENGITFGINNENFIFNSEYCDIDLYKLRIYQQALNVNQIITNFAVDRKDIDLFDQRALAQENLALSEYQLSYDSMLEYNEKHPNAPLMPYIIFDTGNADSRLPYSKDDTKQITVEFVNTPLELAYTSGRLEQLARDDGIISETEADGNKIKEAVKTYYKHHCPSFTTSLKTSDKVKFEVQGTSSQFYPRRNYKIKTKMDGKFNWKDNADLDEEERTDEGGAYTEEEGLNIFMNRGPFAEDFVQDQIDIAANPKLAGYEKTRLADGWYMNNYTNPTDRWTMKVDYMESSGSYNAGFASFVGNGYTKHPLQDYIKAGVLGEKSKLKPVVSTSTADADGMRWEDFRTSLLGFPVMAFWRKGTGDNVTYTFIGYYRMLLDKSSTQVLGFKTPKKVTHNLFPYVDDEGKTQYKRLRDVAECWEFSNNARGFCSYRDRWNRVELSFKAPAGVTDKDAYTAKGAPIVADDFEYRYHSLDDYIDILYDFDAATQADLNEVAKEFGLPEGSIIADNRESGADALLLTHKNWEKVCKWVYSTNPDAVDSQGIYTIAPVGNVEYKADGTFFIIDENNKYVPSTAAFDVNKTYYKLNEGTDKEQVPYVQVDAAPAEYVFVKGKFYYLASGYATPDDTTDDVYAISNDEYDGSITYYEFTDSDVSILDTKFDLLVRPVNIESETYDAATQYYTWHGTEKDVVIKKGQPTGAVRIVTQSNKTDWDAGKYYVANPTTYAGKTYTHDTKEYRAAKFTNEFENHFDPEYVATYFVMTEVMECYDSRGKNCMMASWGPHKEGGEYIWYPIFYDIDTQLGINNTGIPSFEYNVDATEAGNYSTSDSILWNNFYRFFKKTWMLPKYQNLRGFNSKFDTLYDKDGTTKKSPLQSVDYIEKWYTFDPDVTHNIACEGIKPLIGTNLDMYFKYITITNPKAKEQGVAHLNDAGEYADPDSGTYFYALQGDRSQSRRQFVASRLEYIDSWLTQGNYARGGANRLWGRISANNNVGNDVHSDKWVESQDKPYWKDGVEFGTKMHEFDAEYWLEPKPIRSSYFTAGDDAANYPSQKYDGANPLKFKLSAIENGIRTSSNYPEQLLYIYGTNQMSDFGDLSKMYWTEFKLEGNADKLTRLKLGHDGKVTDFADDNATEKTELKWYNKKLNGITLPKLPLLKEANFCNITLINATSLDFSASEKLENFRATGSGNITSVKFADGVSLNTLYIPPTLSSLSLVQANLLTDLIFPENSTNKLAVNQKRYSTPVEEAGELIAAPGLYLEKFFEEGSSLNSINFNGGNLGYNSYIILQRLFDKYQNGEGAKITMTDVNWCPYIQLTEGSIYNPNLTYYKDNGHYGFTNYDLMKLIDLSESYNVNKTYYTYNIETKVYNIYTEGSSGFDNAVQNGLYSYDEKQFNADILSKLIYQDNGNGGRNEDGSFSDIITNINDTTVQILTSLHNLDKFKNFTGQSNPDISGLIYIHNNVAINEDDIVLLQKYYPNLIFFFNKVNKAYSAKFVIFNPDDYSEKYVKWANGSTSPSVHKIQSYDENTYFNNPFDPITGFKPEKTHYDFIGWSLNNRNPYDNEGNILDSVITNAVEWTEQKLNENIFDYTYYAIFKLHKYEIRCYNNNDPNYGGLDDDGQELYDTELKQKYHRIFIEYGQPLATEGVMMPQAIDDTPLKERNTFKGWTLNKNTGKVYDKNIDLKDVIMDLNKYLVIKDYKLFAAFQPENVYDSVIDNKYIYYTYDKGYPVINLKPEFANNLSGKITLPSKDFNGNYIKGIGSITSYKPQDATGNAFQTFYQPMGINITHVFFELDSQYEYIGYGAFGNPTIGDIHQLVYIDNLPSSVTTIEQYAFRNMKKLQNVKLSDNITVISTSAFESSTNISYDYLPNLIVTLGQSAFANTNVKFSEVPNSLKTLNMECFKNCYYLNIINLNNIETIGIRCFQNAGTYIEDLSQDEALYITNSVQNIGTEAFKNYKNNSIKYVYTPYSTAEAEKKYGPITNFMGIDSEASYAHLASEGV